MAKVPSVSRTLRSFAPELTPAPWFKTDSAVLGASALKPLASITFALAPPTSQANSIPDNVSISRPTVSWLFVSVKLASRDSYSVSRPRPPSIVSAPAPPEITSLPAPPINTLARALPMMVSANGEPVTLLKPESSLKSVDTPPARFTTTAAPAALKSSELTPVPPFRISIAANVRLFVAPLSILKSPLACKATATFDVTAVKSIVSMPSPSLPPAASVSVSMPQLSAKT